MNPFPMNPFCNTPMARLSFMVFALALTSTAGAASVKATLYHSPGCQCCEQYAQYLDKAGYDVRVTDIDAMSAMNQEHGVPPRLAACHTMVIGDYVVVGHVPEPAIARLLREQPDIQGISLPGMPTGSPGMAGKKQGPFVVRTLSGDHYGTY